MVVPVQRASAPPQLLGLPDAMSDLHTAAVGAWPCAHPQLGLAALPATKSRPCELLVFPTGLVQGFGVLSKGLSVKLRPNSVVMTRCEPFAACTSRDSAKYGLCRPPWPKAKAVLRHMAFCVTHYSRPGGCAIVDLDPEPALHGCRGTVRQAVYTIMTRLLTRSCTGALSR